MIGTNPYNYLIGYISDGKVVELHFLQDVEEVRVFTAIAHGKGYETDVFRLNEEAPETIVSTTTLIDASPPNITNQKAIQKNKRIKPKKFWERPVQCLEMDETFSSVRECADKYGMSYKSVYNAIKSGNPRNGLHFFFSQEGIVIPKRKESKHKKIICLTTGRVYKTIRECLKKLHIDAETLYHALYTGKPIRGRVLAYE